MQFVTRSLSKNAIVFYMIDQTLETARANAGSHCRLTGIEVDDTVTELAAAPIQNAELERYGVFWPNGSEMFRYKARKNEDADFIEFQFADADAAVKAEAAFPSNVVNQGASLALRTGQVSEVGLDIRTKLAAAGLTWTEIDSSLTEADMWPEWPEDGVDDAATPAP